jgi:hypothetical protein
LVGSLAQLGCNEQALNLGRRQMTGALLLATLRELIRRQHDGCGEGIVLSSVHGGASYVPWCLSAPNWLTVLAHAMRAHQGGADVTVGFSR